MSLIVFVDEGGTSWASVRHSPRHCLLRPGQKTWQMLGRTLGAETYIKCKNEDNALQCVECCPRLQQTQLTQAGQGTKGPNGHLGKGLSGQVTKGPSGKVLSADHAMCNGLHFVFHDGHQPCEEDVDHPVWIM